MRCIILHDLKAFVKLKLNLTSARKGTHLNLWHLRIRKAQSYKIISIYTDYSCYIFEQLSSVIIYCSVRGSISTAAVPVRAIGTKSPCSSLGMGVLTLILKTINKANIPKTIEKYIINP